MKITSSLLAHFLEDRHLRQNVRALMRYFLVVAAVVALFTVIFHVIMWNVEGQEHSWITGLYWTFTVMSTLGFGDITFVSDIGRLFSVVVLVTGIVLLLIVLPFAFIRYFYAPWLEAQVKRKAPRRVPEGTRGHVVLCRHDSLAPGLIRRMERREIPYCVIEPDPERGARMEEDGLSVVVGERDSQETYAGLNLPEARLVVANDEDTVNTNVTLTVREISDEVPVAALAASEDSVDILELSGADHVLPLKKRLGEQLANRVHPGPTHAHVVGSVEGLLVAELPVHGSPLVGRTLQELGLREELGLNVVGVWEQARLQPPRADTELSGRSVPVVVGTRSQIDELERRVGTGAEAAGPVVVIGGGKVGRAATRFLKAKGVPVHMIEKKEELRERIGDLPEELFIGDAASRKLLHRAGVGEAPSVVITTNDDAMNIYLSAYLRGLRDDVQIVSRLTHERNIAAIQRAGADLVLSYATLGVETLWALIAGRPTVVLGEGVELQRLTVPARFEKMTLAEAGIGARTGLNVIALEAQGEAARPARPSMTLEPGAELIVVGSEEQLRSLLDVDP